MNDPLQYSDPLEEKLIRAGGLHPEDLASNQAGELSLRQRRWLKLEFAGWVFQIGADLVLMACAWLFYYFQNNLQVFLIGSLFWGLALGMSVLFCIEHAWPVWDAVKSNEVEVIAGSISKFVGFGKGWPQDERSKLGNNWGLKIREQMFSVTAAEYAVLVEHQTYRLFYLPNMKRVINIEPLIESHAKKQSALAALQARARENQE